MKNHISFCVNNSKRLTFCFVNELQDVLRFLSIKFQKVHQTYNRTDMWHQICKALGESSYITPDNLGEDRLARFGAYREFE